jgi:hypothetical protein
MNSMLESHLNAIENVLQAQACISSNAGHPDLIGSPREWFVKNFLIDHLPETVKVGQGEIINSRSQPKSKRNQIDVILYRHDYPKISYSQNNNAFLRESVIATIEVKSIINLGEFRKACNASINHKISNISKNLIQEDLINLLVLLMTSDYLLLELMLSLTVARLNFWQWQTGYQK